MALDCQIPDQLRTQSRAIAKSKLYNQTYNHPTGSSNLFVLTFHITLYIVLLDILYSNNSTSDLIGIALL